jgi:hypothetical protein
MIRAEGAAQHLGVFEGWRLIFLMVQRTSWPQSPTIMGTPKNEKVKMTKQGVRDLNHAVPKKLPAALEVTPRLDDEAVDKASLVAPAPVVAASVVAAPLEP